VSFPVMVRDNVMIMSFLMTSRLRHYCAVM